jgi:magnesium chelatase family protein
VRRYRARVSGPLLDRIDLHVRLPAPDPDAVVAAPPGEASSAVAARVARARARALERQAALNARLATAALERSASPRLRKTGRRLVAHLGLTGRGWVRLLRVARTLADLEDEDDVGAHHLEAAGQYRLPADASTAGP